MLQDEYVEEPSSTPSEEVIQQTNPVPFRNRADLHSFWSPKVESPPAKKPRVFRVPSGTMPKSL